MLIYPDDRELVAIINNEQQKGLAAGSFYEDTPHLTVDTILAVAHILNNDENRDA